VLRDLPARTGGQPRRVSPLWGQLAGVAAALAGVVLIGTAVLSGGGSGASATTTAAFAAELMADEAPAATTAAAESTAEATGGVFQAADANGEDLATQAQRLVDQVGTGEDLSTARSAARLADACPALAELEELASADATVDGRAVVIVVIDTDSGPEARAFFTDDCSEIPLP